jgi:hypothetical protein
MVEMLWQTIPIIMANNFINAEVTSCPDDINSQIEEHLAVFILTKVILNDIINSLEAEIQDKKETIGVLRKDLSDLETILMAEFQEKCPLS